MSPRHIFLIGAARSGTKILRDCIATATGVGRVPYDIGYVWRFGNEQNPDDALTPSQLSERSRRHIAAYVNKYAEGGDQSAVLEKTVGNTLRVPFVAAVFPEATFLHLIRDGVDVAVSSRAEWTAGTEWRYLATKLRHVPPRVLPSYGAKYAASLASRVVHRNSRVGSWGPRYPGIDTDLRAEDLLVVCGRQWRESVCAARTAFGDLKLPVREVRYEALISDPVGTLTAIVKFLDLRASAGSLHAAAAAVRPGRSGAGRTKLSAEEASRLDRDLGALLDVLGYERPTSAEDISRV